MVAELSVTAEELKLEAIAQGGAAVVKLDEVEKALELLAEQTVCI